MASRNAHKNSLSGALSWKELSETMGVSSVKVRNEIETLLKSTPTHPTPDIVRRYFQHKKIKYPQQVISLQMLKGGVAKTTTALNLGLRATMYGARVLFIDLDQQANLTFALGVSSEKNPVWIDILEKKTTVDKCVLHLGPGLDLIPSSLENSVLDRTLMNSQRNWATAISGPLQSLKKNYDIILIDTAPALSVLNTAITLASDLVILPVNPDRFSWLGLLKHREELQEIRKDFAATFQTKILLTRFDGREKVSHEILQMCMDSFAKELFQGYIRTSAELKNTIGAGANIFQMKNTAHEDYDLVTRELLDL